MSDIIPVLIAITAVLLIIGCMVYLHLYVRKHPQPDLARLGLLRVLLGVFAVLFLAYSANEIVRVVSGGAPPLLSWDWWCRLAFPALVFVLGFANVVFQIRQCQRRLSRT